MKRFILGTSILVGLGSISYAGFHFGLGKASAKNSAKVTQKAAQKASAAPAENPEPPVNPAPDTTPPAAVVLTVSSGTSEGTII